MQDQPDQATLSMRNGPDGLIMSEARDATAIDDLEDASFDFYGGVSSLIEQAPHVTVAPVTRILSDIVNSFERQTGAVGRSQGGAATSRFLPQSSVSRILKRPLSC